MQIDRSAPRRTRGLLRWAGFVVLGLAIAASSPARAELMPGNCPPQDLTVTLNTGWDENAEAAIPSGQPDDDWDVLVDAALLPTPRDADVRDPHVAWLTLPDSQWIAATAPSGPNGLYIYEYCWCMDDDFTSPLLTFAIRADDQADVRLNGFLLLSLPDATFNDPIATGMSVIDPSKFLVGLNCMTVHVSQKYGGPHGFNLTGSVTAQDGRCCGCYDLPPDAEGWWRLDETTGTTAADSVGGHDGTHMQFPATVGPLVPAAGKVAGALSFDGVNDFVEVPDDPGLDFDATDDLTIDAWILIDSPLRMPIVNKKTLASNNRGYTFMTASGVLSFEMADGTTTVTCNAGSGLNDNTWHFVAVTLERSNPAGLRLYIDGLFVPGACNPTSVGSMSNNLPMHIGARPAASVGAMWWRGRLDEIEIFRRALTDTEIHELFLAGSAGKCPPPDQTPCSESEYPMCAGICPPGETCVTGPNQSCGCEPLPPCGYPGDFPACNGVCPQGQACEPVPGTTACSCVEEFPACGDTTYPQCNGSCPQGEVCVNEFATNLCQCEPQPAACGDSAYPACGGACPVNTKCTARDVPFPTCECVACPELGPSGLDGISVSWPGTKSELRWTGPLECALVYNVYRFTGARLPDVDADGLAESYGTCFVSDIIELGASDATPPPQPGAVHWYLVTGENFDLEGSLGTNSNQVERPNAAPCP